MLGFVVTTVYTDGACLHNPDGPGGWAWAVPDGPFASGHGSETTNQRMELTAALEAMRALSGPLTVVSDSTYVVNCFRKRWFDGWERRGWTNASRQPVANQDLWKPMVELFHSRGDELTFRWVKGHSGDAMNDLVDRLAVEAARTQQGRSGGRPPTTLGEPDRPTPQRSRAAAGAGGPGAPNGFKVIVLGHRPPQLGGYDENPVAGRVRTKLTEVLAGLAAVHPDLVVLTGLGLGAEQLGAEAAAAAKVAYVGVLAFPDQDSVWPQARRAAYRRLVAAADDTIMLGVPTGSSPTPTALSWCGTARNAPWASGSGSWRSASPTTCGSSRPKDEWAGGHRPWDVTAGRSRVVGSRLDGQGCTVMATLSRPGAGVAARSYAFCASATGSACVT
jgi:ribonuclease HI